MMTEEMKQLKEKHPDTLIVFRAVDFYELHEEDAKTATACLSLPIDEDGTLRFKASELDTYLPKLIRAGHRVAICEKPEPKFEFSQDPEYDGMMTWKNAKTLKRYKELCKERDTVDITRFDCFFAFGDKQFSEGKRRIRPLNDGEKLVSFGGGGYGTKDGVQRLFKFYDDIEKRISRECDPQEVYCYEFNNHESCIAYDGDVEPIRLIARIWGVERAKTIKRRSAFYSLEALFAND